jgi:glycosyltransferase involved in cell wall biosynthesis
MIPNSALITMGESPRTMEKVAAGEMPGAEFAVLRHGHFSRLIAMLDQGIYPKSGATTLRFALQAYRASWREENILLGEEFPGIQYLWVHAVLRRRKRIVMMIHNVASKRRYWPLVSLGLGRFVDHYLCISEKSAEELRTDYHVDAARITVIGSRVDTHFFTPDPSVAVVPQVCAAGAVNRDYETLVEAMRPLDVPVKIAADTAWKYSAGDTQVLTLPPNVEMRSWGNYVNLRALYAQSSVVVVPLKKPMLSGVTVALEAMAMGKPVILTYNDYVREFLRDGENGYFVPPGDVAALRQKVQFLLDHPQEAERVGARAREWVMERFTVAQYIDRIMSVWQKLPA